MIILPVHTGSWKPIRWGLVISFLLTVFSWLGCIDKSNTTCNLHSWDQYLIVWISSFITITAVLYFFTVLSKWLSPEDKK